MNILNLDHVEGVLLLTCDALDALPQYQDWLRTVFFNWLKRVDAERQRRWGHQSPHKTLVSCERAGILETISWLPKGRTPHVNCARNAELGIDFTWVPDTHKAYRMYLSARWIRQSKLAICKWSAA